MTNEALFPDHETLSTAMLSNDRRPEAGLAARPRLGAARPRLGVARPGLGVASRPGVALVPSPGATVSYRPRIAQSLQCQVVVVPPGRGGLTEDERARVKGLGDALEFRPAAVGPGGQVKLDVRRSRISWIQCEEDSEWLFSRMLGLAEIANEYAGWCFDIDGPTNRLQLSRYDAEENGSFGWHMDLGLGPMSYRKVSVVVQLEAAQEGGVLQFRTGGNARPLALPNGAAVIFPSYLQHRVTPVLAGRRVSLVSWVCGPRFR